VIFSFVTDLHNCISRALSGTSRGVPGATDCLWTILGGTKHGC